ncbi:signal transduction histidine kinase/FixJ family two-component response regulator/HPt (histidine-containing phosphotransfer) domain-containing protein [Azospirillum agricola]|uniref:ATP-binding protein n=1 Tax=Azospirillum agricola TaxID=1720247 RepID=UPI001AE70A70|nr:ATP-binding protein [Azospirillum agricola]MBP2229050.1 signal transduction histidine kinase/FixJ family two-component response regulator/HPt (histidine-containing phosphotransfer) domain-containing protein [Azospirillum agricola]
MLDILTPDVRTVMTVQMVLLLLFTGIFAIVWRQSDGNRAAGLLALGVGLGVAGNILWVLRGAASPLWSIIAANVLMHLGTLLVCWAAGLLAGRRFPAWIIAPVIAADTLFFVYFTLFQPDFQIRLIAASGLFGIMYLSAGSMLFGERRPWRLVAVRCAAISIFTLGLIHSARAVLVLTQDGSVAEQSEVQRGGLLLLFLSLLIAGLVSLLWVHMADAQNALQEEVENRRASEAALARAKEEAERVADARTRFLANMSHEIRTPMNAVAGLVNLLGQTSLDIRQRTHVTRIAAAAGLLLRLTDGVLNVTRMEAGQSSLDESDFDLGRLLDDVAGAIAPAAEAKGLCFAIDRSGDVPTALHGDAGRLAQILLNLAGNAVKFTESGSVLVSVEPRRTSGGMAGLRITVRDTGPGIAHHHLSDIFEPFLQPDAASARKHGGSGLGLAIARQAATLMGGTIAVDSKPGRGSIFTVDLPFGIAAHPIVQQTTSIRLNGVRILVVDDDEINREVAREILEQVGASVETVMDGREAVARTIDRSFGIDAVLMDVRMPGIDGFTATAFIREQRSFSELPVIAVTAHAFEEERRQCLAAGMNDFVTKPVAPERLLAILARWLPQRVGDSAHQASRDADRLPEAIDGFDLAAAVERFCGNTALVRHLLERFSIRCAEAVDVLAAPDDSGLRRYLHRLQGAAATLGAERIAGHAAHLIRLLDEPNSEAMKAQMTMLTNELSAAAAAIRASGFVATRLAPSHGGDVDERNMALQEVVG